MSFDIMEIQFMYGSIWSTFFNAFDGFYRSIISTTFHWEGKWGVRSVVLIILDILKLYDAILEDIYIIRQ